MLQSGQTKQAAHANNIFTCEAQGEDVDSIIIQLTATQLEVGQLLQVSDVHCRATLQRHVEQLQGGQTCQAAYCPATASHRCRRSKVAKRLALVLAQPVPGLSVLASPPQGFRVA